MVRSKWGMIGTRQEFWLVNLRRLKYFVKIVDIGSLTQAADILHIAQPALSQQLARAGGFALSSTSSTAPTAAAN